MDALKASYISDSEDSGSDGEKSFSISEPVPFKGNNEQTDKAGKGTYKDHDSNDISEATDQSKLKLCLDPTDAFTSNEKESESRSSKYGNQIFDVNESKTDFFGLSGGDSDDEEKLDLADRTDKVDIVSLRGQKVSVQIPSTSFWSKLDASELQSYQVLDSNFSKRKLNSSNEVSYNNKIFRVEKYRDKESGKYNTAFAGDKTHLKVQFNEHAKIDLEKRQLFYIHSKIQPHLHGKICKQKDPVVPEWTVGAHAGAINRIKWNISELSHLFVTCSMDSTIKVWNIWTQLDPCLSVIKVHDKAVRDIDWNQDGKKLLSCSYDRTAKVIDVEKGNPLSFMKLSSFITTVIESI